MCHFDDINGVTWSYAAIRSLMAAQNIELYPMSLVGQAADVVELAANQGIDAHLESCFCPSRGDHFKRQPRMICGLCMGSELDCKVSAESLPVLLRRLSELEHEDDDLMFEAQLLASDIIDTLLNEH